MKIKHTAFLILAALVAITVGCRRSSLGPLGWDSVSPEVDSLTLMLERCITNDENPDSAEILLKRLQNASVGADSRNLLRERIAFFHAGILLLKGKREEAAAILKQLETDIDSASAPYITHRIKTRQRSVSDTRSYKVIPQILEEIEYYKKVGDKQTEAFDYISLYRQYIEVGLDSLAIQYNLMADRLLGEINYEEDRFKNQVNLAIAYNHIGETSKCKSLIRNLVNDSRCKDNPLFTSDLLLNAYALLNEKEYLERSYELLRDKERVAGRAALLESQLAMEALKSGNYDSARFYCGKALQKLDSVGNFTNKAIICDAAYIINLELPDYEKALSYHLQKVAYKDSAQIESGPLEVARLRFKNDMENHRRQSEQWQAQMRLIAVIVVLSILMVAALVIIVLLLRSRKLSVMFSRVSKERDMGLQSAAASMLAASEKESRLKELAQLVEESKNAGKISLTNANELMSSIKVNMAESGDWNQFMGIFSRLHPDFDKEIHALYPSLSPKQFHLCCYIKMGLDTNQIARILSVKPESVWQKRWRLKQKMGLESDESLTELLNTIGS